MLKTIDASEFKTEVGQILYALEQGDEFIITQNGKTIGRLQPFGQENKPKHRLGGFLEMPKDAGKSLLEPMTEEELQDWYGQ